MGRIRDRFQTRRDVRLLGAEGSRGREVEGRGDFWEGGSLWRSKEGRE